MKNAGISVPFSMHGPHVVALPASAPGVADVELQLKLAPGRRTEGLVENRDSLPTGCVGNIRKEVIHVSLSSPAVEGLGELDPDSCRGVRRVSDVCSFDQTAGLTMERLSARAAFLVVRLYDGGEREASMTSPLVIPIFLDADACPVKDETYRVAQRRQAKVIVVANSFIAVPREPWIERVIVGAELDAADDWIAARAAPSTIVVTADVPLASRCVKAGATVLAPNGRLFTEASIGMDLATRNLMADLRAAGTVTGGPKPFAPRDRSNFLSALDQAILRLQRSASR